MGSILVVGCVSFDILRLERDGRVDSFETVGGAGLYTALAAVHQGADVVLYAPRPDPMPEQLQTIEAKLTWLGPHCAIEEMPRLEIVHHGGGRATLVSADWGAEDLLVPDCLPEVRDFDFDIVHIAALSSVQKQNDFCKFFSETAGDVAQRFYKISAGTYARAISSDKGGVEQLIRDCDVFFMNRNEADLLFGNNSDVPNAFLNEHGACFVTDGESGVKVYQPESTETVLAVHAEELDPTGAGDTFCGSVLARLSGGVGFVDAARAGVAVAARAIEQPGPKYLLSALAAILVFASVLTNCGSAAAKPIAESSHSTSARRASSNISAPDIGNAVGEPTFYLKDGQKFTGGKIFSVYLKTGKSVFVTPLHLVGPSTGFLRQLTAQDCQSQLVRVEIRDFKTGKLLGIGTKPLLLSGDLSRSNSGDLRGDLLALKASAKCKLQPLKLRESVPALGTPVFLFTNERAAATSLVGGDRKVQPFSATVKTTAPGHIVIKMDRAIRLGALSGSPVLDERGFLVGMVYGGREEEGVMMLNPGSSIYSRLNTEIKSQL